jgi:hypothetical protein
MQGVQEHSTCARRRCGYAGLQGDGGPDDVPVKQSRFAEHCSTSQQWSVTGAGGGRGRFPVATVPSWRL